MPNRTRPRPPLWQTFGRADARTALDAATTLHLTALTPHKQR